MLIDLVLFNFIHSAAGAFKLLDWFGIFAANYLPYFLVIGLAYLIFQKKVFSEKFYALSLIFLSTLLSRGIISETIRFFYDRPRPFETLGFEALINHPASSAFPSGHAAVFFAVAMAVYYIDRRWFSWAMGSTILMGIARVFVGVHWPMDIVAGAAIAIGSVFVVRYFLPKAQG